MELLLGLLKNDQLDDALRFCAETGVYAVRLLICERSVPVTREPSWPTRWRAGAKYLTKRQNGERRDASAPA
ncbi:MAG: hypothetical protein ACLUEQ_02525 [Cloacibacillus evryensis]